MISNGQKKLIRRYSPHRDLYPDEFYDLTIDPIEARNLIDNPASQNEIMELSIALEDNFRRFEDPLKSVKNLLNERPCNASGRW